MGSIKDFFLRFFSLKNFSLFLLLICFLTYGLLVPFLGFYWDDFPYVWFDHIGGISSVFQAVAEDRPALAVLFGITAPLVGENPIAWQIFGIFCRWLCSLSIFWLLVNIYPSKQKQAAIIAILFAVYPGLSQQWIAVIYSRVFILFAIYFFSHFLMIRAVRDHKHFWLLSACAILLSLFCMAANEYTFGLELLRPAILWIIFSRLESAQNFKKRIKRVAFNWLPYLLGLIAFSIYRAFLATSVLYKVQIFDDLSRDPFGLIINFFTTLLENLYKAGLLAWIKPILDLSKINFGSAINVIYLTLIFFCFLLSLIFLKHLFQSSPKLPYRKNPKNDNWAIQAILLGIYSILIAGIPFFVVQLKLQLHFPYDRFILPMILGACILLVGIVDLIIHSLSFKFIVLSLVISLSIGSQFQNANSYRLEWKEFQQFFWQLRWRIPELKENTMLLTDELPFNFYSDNSLTAPLNWLYSPYLNSKDGTMPYVLNFTKVRLGNRLPRLDPDLPIDQYYRIVNFKGNTSQTIVFQYSPPGCLHVLDTELDLYNPTLPKDLILASPLSNLSRISNPESEPQNLPYIIFGQESPHNWCYFYEKAELARQAKNWKQITQLGEMAFKLDDYPNDPVERFPFIEAYANFGNWQDAIQLSKKTMQISSRYSRMLCGLWNRILSDKSTEEIPSNVISFVESDMLCS